jgi:hypothetical protein
MYVPLVLLCFQHNTLSCCSFYLPRNWQLSSTLLAISTDYLLHNVPHSSNFKAQATSLMLLRYY